MRTNVKQKFYTNQKQNWLVIFTSNIEADSSQICNISIDENPDNSISCCQVSLYEPDTADHLMLNKRIDAGILKETTIGEAKSIIKKYESRSKELLNFCNL